MSRDELLPLKFLSFDFDCCWSHLTSVHSILAVGKLLENIDLGFDKLHLDGKELAEIEVEVVKL